MALLFLSPISLPSVTSLILNDFVAYYSATATLKSTSAQTWLLQLFRGVRHFAAHGCRIETCQPFYHILGNAAKAYQWVDKIHLAIVTKEHIVTMSPDIRDGHHAVSKEISILPDKPSLRKQRLNLILSRESFCTHSILLEHHANLAKFQRNTDEFISAFGEKYVVNDMLVYPIRLRSVLERTLRIRILDLVECRL